MDSKSLLTSNYRLNSANRFIDSVNTDQYYLFVGNHLNPNTISQPADNPSDTTLSVYYNMVFGKKINPNNVSLMVNRYDYQANTVYQMYWHNNPNLYTGQFFVVVHDGTQYDVFKCLDNNGGARSMVSPSRSEVNVDNDDFYYPTDGYRWKYMYSISDAEAAIFATEDYFPVVTDAGVRSKAVDGAIDVIAVTNPGEGYSNYINGTFGVGDIRLNGDTKKYGISTSGVSSTNGFYDACWLYISSGAGAGQFRQIESYASNSTHNFVILSSAFDSADQPENTSVFEIYPAVDIRGDGAETIEAKARAIINPVGNTVDHVEMLVNGRDYNLASASVIYSGSVGVTEEAGIVPVYAPKNGHGYDPAAELGAKQVCVSLTLQGSESNTVIVNNDYSQWGIIKNPLFNKVSVVFNDLNKQFSTTEFVYKIDPIQLYGLASSVKNANNELTNQFNFTGLNPSKLVKVDDRVLLSFSNTYLVANVLSTSNTSITVSKTSSFDTASAYSANLYLLNASVTALVDGYSANSVDLTNVSGPISIGDVLISEDTGTRGTVASFTITDATKGFGTYVQAYTYIGSVTSGAFVADEQVYQIANIVANAKYHSIAPDIATGTSRFYMTHQTGIFNTSVDGLDTTDEINGNISGAIAVLTNKYLPDLVFGSGEVMYVENFPAITRTNEKTETFKLIMNF